MTKSQMERQRSNFIAMSLKKGASMTTILIADDNVDLRRTVEIFLVRLGFQVLTVGNGREAVEAVREYKPDLILMDMNMPVLDGWGAASELKNDTRTAGVPIIAVTAYTLPGDQARCLAAGCDLCLSKPVELDKLAVQIHDQLAFRLRSL